MAKGSGGKRSKKSAVDGKEWSQRAARLEKALARSLRREAKAASRLEAAQLEVAVLRVALAEVIGKQAPVPAPDAVPEPEALPATERARPQAVRAATKQPAAGPRRRSSPPAATTTRARRTTRSGPGSETPDS